MFSSEAFDDMDTQQMNIWDRARGTQVEAGWSYPLFCRGESSGLTLVAEGPKKMMVFGVVF